MAASPVFGAPQWATVRTVSGSTAAGTFQFDTFSDGLTNTTTPFSSAAASHIITAGPQTAGPVIVSVNGATWILPFNRNFNAPPYVTDALDSSVWTFT